ncbi:MAG: hypothetical protein J5640_00655 [Bacteroidales bacterium]|nr:hypothetical protein [Bacteroidales bacterium]
MRRLWVILAALLLSADIFACTTAVVSSGASASGRPMLWKQRDTSDPYNRIVHVKDGVEIAYTALFPTSDSLCTLAYAGINAAGFGVINNLSYNLRPDSLGFDTKAGPLMAKALGCCRTVDDFERLLQEAPRPMLLSTNFGVVDAAGGAAYFEVSDYDYTRFDVEPGGYLFRTNYSLTGEEGRGRGFARYEAMGALMATRRSFDPEFFFKIGRTYYRDGRNALRWRRRGWLDEHDFIPRSTTTACVVIEAPGPGEAPDGGLMWCAPGYTPCCYAIPVWVAAGDNIPACLTGQAEANRLAAALFLSLHSDKEELKKVDIASLRRVMRPVRRAERREFRRGRRLDRRMHRAGYDAAEVERFNHGADARFRRYKHRFAL